MFHDDFVEGAIDALSYRILSYGINEKRAVLGLAGVSDRAACCLRLVKGRRSIVAFDVDAAGGEAFGGFRERPYDAGATEVVRSRPVGAKDWNEVLVGLISTRASNE